MQVEAMFRRRAQHEEDIYAINKVYLKQLSKIHGLLAEGKSVSDASFDLGSGENAATNLSPCLDSRIKGAMLYASRYSCSATDKAVSDDSIILQFDSDAVDFQYFCNEIFPSVVNFFLPYRAVIITDIDQALDDYEEIVQEAQDSGLDIDGRDTVYRIHLVNYFDDLMCSRAFNLTIDEMIKKLENSVERVEKIANGLLIIVKSDPITGPQLITMSNSIRQILTQ